MASLPSTPHLQRITRSSKRNSVDGRLVLTRHSIVSISGIGGHAFGSFKEGGEDHMWLRDSLPFDLIWEDTGRPMARSMIYGYESTVAQSENIQNLEDLATSFHASMLALERGAIPRPVILVAHSLGGLIVKQVSLSYSECDSLGNILTSQ